MDQIDPQNQYILVGTNTTRIFRNLNAGRMIMVRLCAGVRMRSMMMRKMAVSIAASCLEAD